MRHSSNSHATRNTTLSCRRSFKNGTGLRGALNLRRRHNPRRISRSQPLQGPAPATSTGPAHQLFIGIRGAVLAIDRINGQELWRSTLKGRDFVNVVLEGGDLYAATQGELFCLDPGTGHVRWHTQLKGLGRGLVTIAGNQQTVVLRAKRRQEEEAADAGNLMLMTAMMFGPLP